MGSILLSFEVTVNVPTEEDAKKFRADLIELLNKYYETHKQECYIEQTLRYDESTKSWEFEFGLK
jgi:hypothetical protein